jgi:hypothetical protein
MISADASGRLGHACASVGIVNLEELHAVHQRACTHLHGIGGRRGFLDQRGVALRHFIHLANGAVDLLNAGRLFVTLRGDGADGLRDVSTLSDNLPTIHSARPIICVPLSMIVTDSSISVRISRDAVRELRAKRLNFGRDDVETFAGFTRTRRFYRCVQRKDVRLRCNAIHGFRNLGNADATF